MGIESSFIYIWGAHIAWIARPDSQHGDCSVAGEFVRYQL